MKRIIVICEPETEYALRLMEFINRKKNFPLRAAAFDSFLPAAEFIGKNGVEILLLSEKFLDKTEMLPEEKVKKMNVKKCLILTEDQNGTSGEYPNTYKRICKYAPAETIVREVRSVYDAEMKALHGIDRRPGEARVYGIYSPVGGSGKTSLALTLGQELARDHKVLYLNMESCSALEEILGAGQGQNISDLIYCIRQNPEELAERIAEMTVSIQNLDCILPVSSIDDIACVAESEWMEMINRVAAEGAYDIVLIEPESGMQGFAGILESCTKVFIPAKNDAVSMAKIEGFESKLKAAGAEDIIDRFRKVKVPFYQASGLGRNYYEGLLWSELGDCVRQLIKKEKIA